MIDRDEAWRVLQSAQRLVSAGEIESALQRLAAQITAALSARLPLVVTVMGGAVVFSGQLLPRLAFPLELDYIHVTRYGDATAGGRLEWRVQPCSSLVGRTVLVLDDILDEGLTLAAIRDGFMASGAEAVFTAVMTDKRIGREKPIRADFVGVELPDRYVFGFGMDVRGAWRNLPEIYALAQRSP